MYGLVFYYVLFVVCCFDLIDLLGVGCLWDYGSDFGVDCFDGCVSEWVGVGGVVELFVYFGGGWVIWFEFGIEVVDGFVL